MLNTRIYLEWKIERLHICNSKLQQSRCKNHLLLLRQQLNAPNKNNHASYTVHAEFTYYVILLLLTISSSVNIIVGGMSYDIPVPAIMNSN